MKKILVNAYTALNLGDDLFLKILFDRYDNVNWVINTQDKRYEKIFSSYKNVSIRQKVFFRVLRKLKIERYLLNEYKDYDSAITIGGSMFMENINWSKGFLKLRDSILGYKKYNKKYFILGCNFGPYKSKSYFESYRDIFKVAEDICFREEFSYKLFSELDNVRVAPDIVFSLKYKQVKKVSSTLGISIIKISDRENLDEFNNIYLNKIKEIVEKSISRGIKVTFFSFCESQGDLEAISSVINLLDKKVINEINIVNYDGNIDGFIKSYASMENIIGTRFHACILSQVFKQGLYPIIYSDKTLNVLNDIGLHNEYTYISEELYSLDVDRILDIINTNILDNSDVFHNAEKHFEGLDKYVRM